MGTMSFGQAAISMGLVTESDVQECTLVQHKMREMGVDEPLGEIMVKKGRLTAQQHQQILKKLGIHVSPIPGYSILSKIGQGGMGTVYKATQSSVNRTVAIKIMSAQATQDQTYVARFLQEAQAAGRLNHKNLIAAIDAGAAGGYYYFVMEYVTGKSAREMVNTTGAFDEKSALRVAVQMSEVLDHIHQHKMVHRDIKPENILLTPDMTVKLCDLGLAKSTMAKDQSLTQEGLAVGTPYFMSPEQIRGDKDIDIRADLYSLGATLFFLVSQRHPFEGKSAAETMSMHLKQAVPDVRKAAPKIGEDSAHVIHKLMAKNRAERYQTPLDLAEDLRTIHSGNALRLARQSGARHASPKASSTQRFERANKKMISAPVAAASGIAVAALAATLVWGSSGQQPVKASNKPAPGPVTVVKIVESRGPDQPKDDPARVRKASQLFAQAEQAYAAKRWAEAGEVLGRLHTEFGSLQFTSERSSSIGKMIGECEENAQRVAEDRNGRIQEARRELQEGRWKEAYGRFQMLGEVAFSNELARCRREMEAEALLGQLRVAQELSDWKEIRQKVGELEEKFPESETAAKWRSANRALLAKAIVEQETGDLIGSAFAAYVKLEWKESQRLLAEIERRRDTDAYRANLARIRELAGQLSAGMAKETEDQAKQAWAAGIQSFDNFLSARRFDDAVEVLKTFQREQAHTKYCDSKKTEVEVKVAEAWRRKAKDREDEAKKLWSSAQRDIKAQNYDPALEAVTRLLGDLADTSAVKTNERTLRQFKALCEQGQGVPDNVLVMLDFEDYPGLWNTHGGATAVNGIDAYQGRRAARLTLLQKSWAAHPIQGISSKAETLSFYARSLKKAPVAVVHTWMSVQMDDDSSISYAGPSVSLGPEWKLCTFKMSDFKTDNQKVKQRTISTFDKIRSIGWEPGTEAGECEIQIDALRIESGRK
jgi:serine/threonine protein kinase/tetratricopeptide (TPR) repeat protein